MAHNFNGTRTNVQRGEVQTQKKRIQRLRDEKQPQSTTVSSLPPVAGILTHLSILNSPSGSPPSHISAVSSDEEVRFNQLVLTPEEVIFHLHRLQQPITLFEEDDTKRLARLKTLLKLETRQMTEAELIKEGQPNLPLDLVNMKTYRWSKEKDKFDNSAGLGDEGIEGISSLDNDADHLRMKFNFDSLCSEYKIMVFFKQLLKEWESELEKRPVPEKATRKGISNVAIYKQCVRNLIPLLKMCKERTLPADLGQALLNIVIHCLQRDYLSALNQYVKLVMSKAPLPIEDTMVDIRERSRREKIYGNSVAQMKEDETRRYMQSVKCLMTLCQRRYPWVPSKSAEFNGLANGNGPQSLFTEQNLKMMNHML